MATKRTKRIDPNEAFAAIVGSTKLDEDTTQFSSSNTSDTSTNAITPHSASPSIELTVSEPEIAKATFIDLQAEHQSSVAESAITPQDIPAAIMEPEENKPTDAPRLVQKGYYITEEQHKKLGFFAVLQGTDRSAIVRNALNMYFETNKNLF